MVRSEELHGVRGGEGDLGGESLIYMFLKFGGRETQSQWGKVGIINKTLTGEGNWGQRSSMGPGG